MTKTWETFFSPHDLVTVRKRMLAQQQLTPVEWTAALLVASRALLAKIDNMTSEEFQNGGDKVERERLSLVIQYGEKAGA